MIIEKKVGGPLWPRGPRGQLYWDSCLFWRGQMLYLKKWLRPSGLNLTGVPIEWWLFLFSFAIHVDSRVCLWVCACLLLDHCPHQLVLFLFFIKRRPWGLQIICLVSFPPSCVCVYIYNIIYANMSADSGSPAFLQQEKQYSKWMAGFVYSIYKYI